MLPHLLVVTLLVSATDACSCSPPTLQSSLCTAQTLVKVNVIEEIHDYSNYYTEASERYKHTKQFRVDVLRVFRGDEIQEGELVIETAASITGQLGTYFYAGMAASGNLCGVDLPIATNMLLELWVSASGTYRASLCRLSRDWDALDDHVTKSLEDGTLDCDCQSASTDTLCCAARIHNRNVHRCVTQHGMCSKQAEDGGACGWQKGNFKTCLKEAGFALNTRRCVVKKRHASKHA